MVRHGSSTSSSKNIVGLQNPVPNKATFGKIIKTTKIVPDPLFNRNEKRNTNDVKKRRYSPKRPQNGIFLDDVSQNKARWNKQTNFQPKKVKSICTCSQIQTPKPLPDTISTQLKRLYGKNRHLTSLLSYTNNTNTLQVPVSSIRRENLRDDMSPVRAIKCSSCFLKSNQLVSTLVQTNSGRKDDSLPGRLSHCQPKPKHIRKTDKVCSAETRRAGLVNKQKEVPIRTYSMPRIFRHNLEHSQKHKTAITHKDRTNQIINPKIHQEKSMELDGGKNVGGKIKLCSVHSSARKATLSLATNRVQHASKIKAPQAVPYDKHNPGRAGMVDRKCKQKYAHTPPQSNNVHYHRCGRFRVGRDSERPEALGSLDKRTTTLALQPKRTLGTLRNPKTHRFLTKRRNGDMANGQPNCSGLHNKTRRYKVKKTFRNINNHPSFVQSIRLHHDSSLHPRTIQRTSRQPFQDKKPTGMAFESSDDKKHFSSFRYSGNRLVCVNALSSSTKLCVRRRNRFEQSVHRRLQPELELQPWVDFSPSCSYSKSASSPTPINRGISPSSPGVAQSILGARNKETSNPTTMEDPRPPSPPRRLANEPPPSGSRQPQFAGLDSTGWANELSNWNDYEVELLQASWRKSTLNTYRPAWLRWCRWASDNNVKADDPGPANLARYLCYLCEVVKLAPRTIILHKSVVATFTNPHKSSSLSSHPMVAHAVKGILSKKPNIKNPLSWQIDDLIKFLESYNIDSKSLFAVSRHTCTLLLLASGRRVHDLTLLSIHQENLEEKDGDLIFWPKFGSKTDSTSYRQSGWRIRTMPTIRFNIVHWIKQVISLSQERRGSKQLENLFITTRGAVKGASRAVIAGWIKTIFREAKIASSAGSIRASVATNNWTQKNMDIDEVLKRGNWRSRNTFLNHYFREVCPTTTTHPTSVDLSTCFAPVE